MDAALPGNALYAVARNAAPLIFNVPPAVSPVPRHPNAPGAALTQGASPQAYPRLGVFLW